MKKNHITAAIIILLLIALLAPLYAIAPYTHPSGDDYTYGSYTVHVWQQSGSVFKTIGAGISAAAQRWQSWQGTHTAIFTMTMMPAVFGYKLYPLGAIALLTVFLLSSYFLFDVILRRGLRLSRLWSLGAAAFFAVLSTQFAPAIVEGFFWFNGAWYYTFYFTLAMLWLGLILRLRLADLNKTGRILRIAALIFLSFWIGGGNYPLILPLCLASAALVILDFYRRNEHKFITLSFTLVLLASSALSMLAPGNSVRAGMNVGMSAPKAVALSIYNAAKLLLGSLKGLELVAFIAVLPLIFWATASIAKSRHLKFKRPLLAFILSFGLFASMFTPSLFAMSNIGPGRIQDIYHYAAVLLIMFNLSYLCGWLGVRYSIKIKPKECACILFAAALVLCAACDYSDLYALNSFQAAKQLASGEAKAHSAEMDSRQSLLNNSTTKEVVLEPLSHKPTVIFLWDITADASTWRNLDMAKYYSKESIKLSYDDGGY
ncbi:MAG: DUF6056 family protein [Oscillospiraceae bacterium]|jgi:hypothetical protein|nr:DUF6056 family protein [Oscillospiraceae bacterium]